jgi:hypothetical protein
LRRFEIAPWVAAMFASVLIDFLATKEQPGSRESEHAGRSRVDRNVLNVQ